MGKRIKCIQLSNHLFTKDAIQASLFGEIFKRLDKDTLLTDMKQHIDQSIFFYFSNPKYNEVPEGVHPPTITFLFRREPDGSVIIESLEEFKEEGTYSINPVKVLGVLEVKTCGCGSNSINGGGHMYYCDLFEKE